MFRARIGHNRARGGFRISRTGSHFSPKNADKTLHHIERFIEESKSQQPSETLVFDINHSFQDFALPEFLQSAIVGCGFSQPTPIQDRVIPEILEGNDIIGLANTGTGKTGAFLLPLIARIHRQELHSVMILAPTRELAIQIQQDFNRFAKGSGLFSVLCIGGTSVNQQIRSLQRKSQFLIGTPGRVKDMVSQQFINLHEYDAVVLDEVDRMLDMGFIHDVRELLYELPKVRQSLFFSATLPPEVERLCQSFAQAPVTLSVKTADCAHTVDQKVIKLTPGQQKVDALYDLLCNQEEYNKVLIFGRTKHGVRRLAEELDRRGFAVDAIHGNKSQAYRQRSLERFKRHEISILVATDVAARGIDVADVSHVINFDVPETIEDYVHRIGRTGRAGKIGVAVTFVI